MKSVLKYLSERALSTKAPILYDTNKLIQACGDNKYDEVVLLLNGGANPNFLNPLKIAIYTDINIVKALIDAGADYNTIDEHGETILMLASGEYPCKLDIYKYLLNLNDLDLEVIDPEFSVNALGFAIAHGNLEHALLLLNKFPHLATLNMSDIPPIFIAFYNYGDDSNFVIKITDRLLRYGADINTVDSKNKTILKIIQEFTSSEDQQRILKFIKSKGGK